MIAKLAYYFSFPFVRYALIVGVLIALCSSLLGVTLVLKRFSFIGDGLSHVAFGLIAIAAVLNLSDNMILVLPGTILCAVLLLRNGQKTRIKGDAAIAMLSTGALAIGYLLMNVFSASSNVSGDVCSTLFGSTSILTLSAGEVGVCAVLSVIVGVALGTIAPEMIFIAIGSGLDGGSGIMNMYDITVISIICAGIIGLVRDNGGIEWILQKITGLVRGKRGAQFGIAALASLVDVSTANNTVAIVIAGPIARKISDQYDISPRRTASLIDIFTSVWQGIIPYGAQILYASAGAAAVGMAVTPFEIIPFLFYPYLLGICALIFIAIWGNKEKMR